jgi:hypothetical protein
VKADEIDRRDVVKTFAIAPVVLPLFALGAAAAPPYSPKFFSADDLQLVATLGELIIPQTETPGALAAKVHEHIDLVLSEETPDVQHSFRDGLAWIERRSREMHNRAFLALTVAEQNALLTRMADSKTPRLEDESGYRFFLALRKRVVFAYYTSEIGLRQELTYKGKQALSHWEGCPHSDHHGDAE